MNFLNKIKETKEIKEIKGHILYQRAVLDLIKNFKELKEKNQKLFDKAVFCPHITGSVGLEYRAGFGDHYCIEGVPSKVQKIEFNYRVWFKDKHGREIEKNIPRDLRKDMGERLEVTPMVFKPCMYWDSDNRMCNLKVHNES